MPLAVDAPLRALATCNSSSPRGERVVVSHKENTSAARATTAATTGLLVFLLSTAALSIAAPAAAERRPTGTSGPEADALARRMLAAVDEPAWQRTGAVRWTFRGDRHHLWDRRRGLARVRWADVEVLVDLASREGIARERGVRVDDDRAAKLVAKAFARWTNDSFWLNPLVKLFDPGTERRLVRLGDGGDALLVEYTAGGLTPGDAYLWLLGADDLPIAWKMWTSNLPKGGVKASWEGWVELATGARIATLHKLALGKVTIEDLAGAATLAELEPGPDPFAALRAGG